MTREADVNAAVETAARVLSKKCRHKYACGCLHTWKNTAELVLRVLNEAGWRMDPAKRGRPGPTYSEARVAGAALLISQGYSYDYVNSLHELTQKEAGDAAAQAALLVNPRRRTA